MILDNQLISNGKDKFIFPHICPECDKPTDEFYPLSVVNLTKQHADIKPEQIGDKALNLYSHKQCKEKIDILQKKRFWMPRIVSGILMLVTVVVGIYNAGGESTSLLYKLTYLAIGAILMCIAWIVTTLFLPEPIIEIQENDELFLLLSKNKNYLEEFKKQNPNFTNRKI